MLTGTVNLRWSAGNISHFTDDLVFPINEDLDVLIEARRGGLDILGSVDASLRFLIESFPRLLLLSEENDVKPLIEFLKSVGVPRNFFGEGAFIVPSYHAHHQS